MRKRNKPYVFPTSMRLAFKESIKDLDDCDYLRSVVKGLKRGAGLKRVKKLWYVTRRKNVRTQRIGMRRA